MKMKDECLGRSFGTGSLLTRERLRKDDDGL
jgi:hypothetical protein